MWLVVDSLLRVSFSQKIYGDSFVEFQNRFDGNKLFNFIEKNGEEFTVGVDVPSDSSQAWKITAMHHLMLSSEKARLLSIEVFCGEHDFIFASWGHPKFDRSMRSMTIKLHNGKALTLQRFRDAPKPDADADAKHFDHKPYLNLIIDSSRKLSCNQLKNIP